MIKILPIITTLITLVFAQDSSNVKSVSKDAIENVDTLNVVSTSPDETVSMSVDSSEVKNTIFSAQIDEAKILLSDAIISDITGDTLSVLFNFKILFESLAQIDEMNNMDDFQELEYNQLLTSAVEYYEKKALTISKIESGLSVALLRDRLDEYTYDQSLEDLEFVDETVEIIEGRIPITYNRKVKSIIRFFQNQGKVSIQKWINRSERYKKIILPILEDEKVPPELFYLAMIESGLNSNAYSYAHASGMWQFISSTGKIYGLKKSWYIDERLDFEKSTRAACHYLKDLYREFGDWYLAFAAYNCGSGRVQRAIKRHGTRDYWRLTTLPKETQNYVPNIMAAIFISMDPEKYGFTSSGSYPDLEWEIVEIKKTVTVEQISKSSGISIKELKLYNPELKQNIIPPLKDDEVYKFRLPLTADAKFDSLFALEVPQNLEEIFFKTHKVRSGENLSYIAKKYKVPMKDIISHNKIKHPNKLKLNQRLEIPISGYNQYLQDKENEIKKIYHTVKPGDTLSEIAEMYKTSIKNIKKWNGIRGSMIRIGQKLEIRVKSKNYSKKSNTNSKNNSGKKVYYTVKYGDTLSEIAEKYNVGLSKLRKWNNIKSSDKIVVGQKLLILSN